MATDPILTESSRLFGDYMLALLRQGGMKVHVKDADGNSAVELVDFTPAMIGKIETYLHHWGMSGRQAGSGDRDLGAVAETVKRLRESGRLKLAGGGTLPPLSERDDAATGTG